MAAKLPDLHSITGNTFCLGLLVAVSSAVAVSYFDVFSIIGELLK